MTVNYDTFTSIQDICNACNTPASNVQAIITEAANERGVANIVFAVAKEFVAELVMEGKLDPINPVRLSDGKFRDMVTDRRTNRQAGLSSSVDDLSPEVGSGRGGK
jgi:hypothetical protein